MTNRPDMSAINTAPPGSVPFTQQQKFALLTLCSALVLMYLPTYAALDRFVWNIVGQGHGPIMLCLALWLAWQRLPKLLAIHRVPATFAGSALLALGLLMYAVGRSQDVLFLDTASHLPVLAGTVLILWGWSGLRVMWFPIFFLLFIIPIPGSVVDAVTSPLKAGVSYVAEYLLYTAGYPIGRSGVTLTIGPYKLLVADACAGLNSIFALEAIGIFYLSIMQHTNQLRNILLAALVIPISFASNVLRVIALVLITYYFGDEAGQGFVHDFAGILLFMVATVLTIATDSVLGIFLKNKPIPNSEPLRKDD